MTATKEITIAGLLVPVAQPYVEGAVMTAAEAKALNQTRAENVRNNMAAAVKKLGVEGKDAEGKTIMIYDEAATTAALAEVATYDAEYTFAIGGGGPARVTDPFERECRSIAREQVTIKIKAAGKKVKDYASEAIEAKVTEWAANPKVQALAKKRIAERKSLEGAFELETEEAPAA
jgi:hypothetical protein